MSFRSILVVSLFLTFISEDAFAQYSIKSFVNHRVMDMAYSAHPKRTDTLCLEGLRRAEEDILKGGKFFCVPVGLRYIPARMQAELEELLTKDGFELVYDTVPEDGSPENQKCYCARITRYQMEKFGRTFRWKMYDAADSLFAVRVIQNNDTLHTWLCDERCYRKDKNDEVNYSYQLTPADSSCQELDFIDVGFTITREGSIGGLYLKRDPRTASITDSCKHRLFTYLLGLLASDGWMPGKLKGQAVNTKKMVRLHLLKNKRNQD